MELGSAGVNPDLVYSLVLSMTVLKYCSITVLQQLYTPLIKETQLAGEGGEAITGLSYPFLF